MWAYSAKWQRSINIYSTIPYLPGLPFNNLVNKWKLNVIPTCYFQRVVDKLQQKQHFLMYSFKMKHLYSLKPFLFSISAEMLRQSAVRRWRLFGGRTGWIGLRNSSCLAEKVGKREIFTCRFLSWPRFYLGDNGKSLVDTDPKKCWKFSRRKTSLPIQPLIQSADDILLAASDNFCFYMLQRDALL